jgi:hypothetical protein
LLAAPGFNSWLEGEPLDLSSILYTPEGKPKISIFSIAHLNDSERMFFVSLLLNQVLGWMRTQSGTTSLRSILYMDEIFGFFPPVANPPSKTPLLTLLKQARAFGVGVVLATQNPVDLDYKGLSNTGTWFIGRLQTERDKARVLEGLEGVAASNGVKWDRQGMEQTLAGLSNRIFLMNNVHDDAPTIFETRWAMSYLRGPLTRNQIKQLMDPIKSNMANPIVSSAATVFTPPSTEPPTAKVTGINAPATRPVLPPKVPQYFIPVRSQRSGSNNLFYQPSIIGAGSIHFADVKTGINLIKEIFYLAELTEGPVSVNWDTAAMINIKINDLKQSPIEPAQYGDLPAIAMKPESYGFWSRDFTSWLYRNQKIDLWKSPSLKEFSRVEESERDFRIRLQQKAREQRDEATDKLRQKYAPKFTALQEQLRRAQATVERERDQVRQQEMNTAFSFGATILGGFLGSRRVSGARSAMGGVGRSMKERRDVERAQDSVSAIQQRLRQMETSFKTDIDALAAKIDPLTEQLEPIAVRPAKTDIAIQILALGWIPLWKDGEGKLSPAWE